jgi:hypothetical protein
MSGWHSSCSDTACLRRCQRPGCLEPTSHVLIHLRRVNKKWEAVHGFVDCTVPRPDLGVVSAARQAIEELNPNMTTSDVAAARRVISKMLDRLEIVERTTVTVIPPRPLLLTAAKEHKRPLFRWLAQRKESA